MRCATASNASFTVLPSFAILGSCPSFSDWLVTCTSGFEEIVRLLRRACRPHLDEALVIDALLRVLRADDAEALVLRADPGPEPLGHRDPHR